MKIIRIIIVALVVGFVVFAIFDYFEEREDLGDIVYSIDDIPTIFYNANEKPVQMELFLEGKPVTRTIYRKTLRIKNTAKQDVAGDTLHQRLTLQPIDSETILVGYLLDSTTSHSIGVSTRLDSNRLRINWKILPSKTTIYGRVLYMGSRESNFNMSGSIEGVRKIGRVTDMGFYPALITFIIWVTLTARDKTIIAKHKSNIDRLPKWQILHYRIRYYLATAIMLTVVGMFLIEKLSHPF